MSKFILAALIFVLINVSLFSLAPLSVGLFQKNAGHRRIIDGLVSIEKMPDILCLGSSIIRLPLWMCDFYSNKDTPAYNRFFKVKSFENYLKAKYKCNRTVANAALDGAMISDDYFFVRKAINSAHRPKMIILCVAPRDFADSLYPDETRTVTFSCLFNPYDLVLNETLFCISMARRAEALGKEIFFLQDNEDRFKSWVTNFISKLANRACVAKVSTGENGDNPLLVSQPKIKSMREYRLRYRNLSFAQVERQSFFSKSSPTIVKICRYLLLS